MKNHMAAGWFYSPEQIKQYLMSRVISLKPPKVLTHPADVLETISDLSPDSTRQPGHSFATSEPPSMAYVPLRLSVLGLGRRGLVRASLIVYAYANCH